MNTSNEGSNNDDINRSNNNNGKNEQRTKGKGRQKIPIQKIENETNLQVTFSKRRAGIFKKASELSTLCGAESAVVIFSPGNKPHSFGHPNVETIANRFNNANNSNGNPQGNAADRLMMAHGEITMYRRNQELIAIEAQLELEKQRKKELDNTAKGLPSLDGLSYEQLEQLKKSVASFKREFEAKLKSNVGETSSWVNPNPNPNPSTQQHQGLGFPAPAVYGYGTTNIVPTNSSSISFGYPLDNFGYTMQYPPIGPSGSGFNYANIGVDPSFVVPYNGTGRASRSRSGTGNRSRSRSRNDMGTNEGADATPQGAQNHNI